ncbi:TIGR04222 domain-containing membrane protein [Streptomyces sp. NPDC046203]|uniref:TIGR04222 domain-containing membrane protein n=1 Tax=Streptomyces sp. NPDC046203 TaxID=3154602 RepID=UPI00340BFED4
MTGTRRGSEVRGIGDELGVYAYAYLAGGGRRVAQSAALSLTERGVLSFRVGRLRVIGDERPPHPVERAVIAACPRSRPAREVVDAAADSPEVGELARGLVALGLIGSRRHRPTRAGRRCLAAVAAEGRLPAYVLAGPAALDPRRHPTPYGPAGFQTLPAGLGRTLIRMGRALDHEGDHHSDSGGGSGGGGGPSGGDHFGGGWSCGGGGGGGGGGD